VTNDYLTGKKVSEKKSRHIIIQMLLDMIQAQLSNIASYLEQAIVPRNENEVLELLSSQELEDEEGEVTPSQTLSLAVCMFNMSDCRRSPMSQIPKKTCQVECSRSKSFSALSAGYVAGASARPSICRNAINPHLLSTDVR
jgi:hypothetical protein